MPGVSLGQGGREGEAVGQVEDEAAEVNPAARGMTQGKEPRSQTPRVAKKRERGESGQGRMRFGIVFGRRGA